MEKKNINKMKITASLKNKMLKDWLTQFSNFYPDVGFVISRRIGPTIISLGFEVYRGGQEYKPGFGLQNLCNQSKFRGACLVDGLRTEKTNAVDTITIRSHENGKYITASEKLKKQFIFFNEGGLSIMDVVNAYKDYLKKNNMMSLSHIEDPALIASWARQENLAKELLEWGYGELVAWNKKLSENNYLHDRICDSEEWYESMKEKISNPQRLKEIAEEQAIFHKVDHIPVEELIIDVLYG